MLCGKAVFVHQSFLIKLCGICQEFLVLFRCRHIAQLAVYDSVFARIREVRILQQEERIQPGIAEQGNLVIGISVSVGIFLLKGFQHLIELVKTGRLL